MPHSVAARDGLTTKHYYAIGPRRGELDPSADDDRVGRPRRLQPVNGLLMLLERNLLGSTVQRTSGSITVTSASAPSASVPLSIPSTLAGLIVIFASACRPVEMARLDELRNHQPQRSLQADDAERRDRVPASSFREHEAHDR